MGPHSYSVEAQPERGRREAPHAKTPRAAYSRRRRTSTRVACLCRPCADQLASSGKAAAPRAIGWLIGVRPSSASGRWLRGPAAAQMPIEAAHGAAAAACTTLPTASSYPGILPRPCRAPGATLRRGKRLLQRQRDHIADIWPVKRKKSVFGDGRSQSNSYNLYHIYIVGHHNAIPRSAVLHTCLRTTMGVRRRATVRTAC